MPDPAPNPELLRSLGRLVRGLSALFWGLPLAFIVCVETIKTDWLHAYAILLPLTATGLLLFGLLQLGSFQKQERPWRSALHRAEMLALINLGLSPFPYWWNRLPEHAFFGAMVCVLAVSAWIFLFTLNLVLLRLGAMLPDETLRLETRQYTALNRNLLIALLVFALIYLAVIWVIRIYFSQQLHWQEQLSHFQERNNPISNLLSVQIAIPALGMEIYSAWLVLPLICLLVLLPIAMTMALIWKTKEVILDSVFSAER